MRRADGYWDHEPDLVGVNHSATLSEHTDFQNLVRVTKEKLGVRQNDEIELTYQWPQWMLGPDWRLAVPINTVDDDDTSLFMSIRAALMRFISGLGLYPSEQKRTLTRMLLTLMLGRQLVLLVIWVWMVTRG